MVEKENKIEWGLGWRGWDGEARRRSEGNGGGSGGVFVGERD